MSEDQLITRDIHNFVRGQMGFEEGLELMQKVSEFEEWIDHLLFDMHLYEMAISRKRKKLNDDLNLGRLGIEFRSH